MKKIYAQPTMKYKKVDIENDLMASSGVSSTGLENPPSYGGGDASGNKPVGSKELSIWDTPETE